MSACSQAVYPPAVIQSVVRQMEAYETAGSPVGIPARMALKPCMLTSNLPDTVVRSTATGGGVCGCVKIGVHASSDLTFVHFMSAARFSCTHVYS